MELQLHQPKKLFAPTVQLTAHNAELTTTRFSHCGDYLASAGFDRKIQIFDVFSPQMNNLLELKGHKNAITEIGWTEDQTLISCSADKTV